MYCTVHKCATLGWCLVNLSKLMGGLKNYVLNCLWSCTVSKNSTHRPMTVRNCDSSSWRLSRWTGTVTIGTFFLLGSNFYWLLKADALDGEKKSTRNSGFPQFCPSENWKKNDGDRFDSLPDRPGKVKFKPFQDQIHFALILHANLCSMQQWN